MYWSILAYFLEYNNSESWWSWDLILNNFSSLCVIHIWYKFQENWRWWVECLLHSYMEWLQCNATSTRLWIFFGVILERNHIIAPVMSIWSVTRTVLYKFIFIWPYIYRYISRKFYVVFVFIYILSWLVHCHGSN